eukprot:scaffold172_cov355-Prasinococcus_capsulatus_cf.AAC.5
MPARPTRCTWKRDNHTMAGRPARDAGTVMMSPAYTCPACEPACGWRQDCIPISKDLLEILGHKRPHLLCASEVSAGGLIGKSIRPNEDPPPHFRTKAVRPGPGAPSEAVVLGSEVLPTVAPIDWRRLAARSQTLTACSQ